MDEYVVNGTIPLINAYVDAQWLPSSRWLEPVVPEVCAGGYGAGSAREGSARSEEGLVV